MSAATLLSMEIDDFGVGNSRQQRKLMDGLVRELEYELRDLLFPPYGVSPQVIAQPAAGGITLLFLHSGDRTWDFDTVLKLIQHLQHWGGCPQERPKRCPHCNETHPRHGFCDEPADGSHEPITQLRFGIHVGSVEPHTDIYRSASLCGDSIVYVQRLMECADGGQVLLSESAKEEYGCVGDTYVITVDKNEVRIRVNHPIALWNGYGAGIQASQLCVDDDRCWNNERPRASARIAASEEPFCNSSCGEYIHQAMRSSSLAFVQGHGDSLFDFPRFSLRECIGSSAQSVWIFLSADFFATAGEGSRRVKESHGRLKKIYESWVDQYRDIRACGAVREVRLFRVPEAIDYSASYLDWDRSGGRIDWVPSIFGIPFEKTPGIVLDRSGAQTSRLYEQLTRSLAELRLAAVDIDIPDFVSRNS